jgi:hypothetical protein
MQAHALACLTGWTTDLAFEDGEMRLATGLWTGSWTALANRGLPLADGSRLVVKRVKATHILSFVVR